MCTPDKDLARCVRGARIVQLDRRTRELRDESAVRVPRSVREEASVSAAEEPSRS